jgi:hypothetical protein
VRPTRTRMRRLTLALEALAARIGAERVDLGTK